MAIEICHPEDMFEVALVAHAKETVNLLLGNDSRMVVKKYLIPFLFQICQKTPKSNQINLFKTIQYILILIPLTTSNSCFYFISKVCWCGNNNFNDLRSHHWHAWTHHWTHCIINGHVFYVQWFDIFHIYTFTFLLIWFLQVIIKNIYSHFKCFGFTINFINILGTPISSMIDEAPNRLTGKQSQKLPEDTGRWNKSKQTV